MSLTISASHDESSRIDKLFVCSVSQGQLTIGLPAADEGSVSIATDS